MAARVLLAEDNESLALVLKSFLIGQGLDMLTAKTGQEALQVLSREGIDLPVLDLKLPVLSGAELLHRLRKSPRWVTLPVIIITGAYKGDGYAEAARRLGVNHYLEKPFTQNLFLESVRKALNKNSRAALDKVKMLLGKSLQSGRSAEAFAFRGWMLLEEGRNGLAEGEFQKALKLNAKEPVARKGLQLIEEKREADKKGLFRKIFG